MIDSIISNFWGDSAVGIYSTPVFPESLSSAIRYAFDSILNGSEIFNLLILITFITTWSICFYIGKKEFKNTLSAALFATIITVAPLRLRFAMEWPNLSYWGFVAGTLYFSYAYIEKAKFNYAIIAGALYGLAFMEHPYVGIMMPIAIAPCTMILFLFNRKKEYFVRSVILGLVLILFAIPGINNSLKTRIRYGNETSYAELVRGESDRWAYSARPWNYLIPDIDNPILGDISVKINYWIWNQKPYYLTEPYFPKEHSLYLGASLILLSLSSIYIIFIKKDKKALIYKNLAIFMISTVVISIILSMPPYIAIKSHRIYFPSYFIYSVLPQLRAYTRFGMIAFIANAILATISFSLLLKSDFKKTIKYSLVGLILLLATIDFSNTYFTKRISAIPIAPYQWITEQSGNHTHLEIPRRTNYTDSIYSYYYNKRLINRYLETSPSVAEIEKSIVSDLGDSKDLICNRFMKSLNGKYILYHNNELIKEDIVNEFLKTGIVTPELKIILSESWGQPVWGNHVPKSDEDLKKLADQRNLLNKLQSDPRLIQVKNFKSGELDNDPHINANDLDEVTIFEINPDYCN